MIQKMNERLRPALFGRYPNDISLRTTIETIPKTLHPSILLSIEKGLSLIKINGIFAFI